MDTVTTYTFFNGFCDGVYTGVQGPDETSLPVGLSLFGDDGQIVKARRPSSEVLVDLGPKFNTPEVLHLIDQQFKKHPEVKRTSGVRVQGVLFKDVPYFLSRITSHPPMQVMVRVWITVHVSTPWPASDADASISYYLFVRLNGSHHISINVDGISVHVDGGWPDGQSIADKLFAAAEKVKLGTFIDEAIAPVANLGFSDLYILPNQGSKDLLVAGNASIDTSLALVI
jgi:hypothetical protein